MQQNMETKAFSSGACVRDIALRLMQMSEAIHLALRQLASLPSSGEAITSPYALLTEEYALRARVSILMIEADRLARPGFPITQQAVLETLGKVENALSDAKSSDDLNEYIASLLLFTSSVISRRNETIALLLNNLQKTIDEVANLH